MSHLKEEMGKTVFSNKIAFASPLLTYPTLLLFAWDGVGK
jgi:hypothetical protein